MFYTQDEQLHQICCTLDEISNIPQAILPTLWVFTNIFFHPRKSVFLVFDEKPPKCPFGQYFWKHTKKLLAFNNAILAVFGGY